MEKFKNKYRIPSARLQNWDYGSEGVYFVTICTQNRLPYFGEIAPVETPCMASPACVDSLQPTEIGKIAQFEWDKIIALRPDMNLQLGNFVVMPNHIHGIIIIGENEYNTQQCGQFDRYAGQFDDGGGDATHCVSTTTTINFANGYNNQFVPQFKNLASIVRGYKSAVTTYARKNGIEFAWQRSFHDYIIRDAVSFQNISNYILNNPQNWKEDKFYE